MRITSMLASTTATFLLLATPAIADQMNGHEVKTARVSYAGIRLDTLEGQAQLKSLVRKAAKQVCDFYVWPREITIAQHACLRAAVKSADAQIAMATERAHARSAMANSSPETREIKLVVSNGG